jgi:hypothetical protein
VAARKHILSLSLRALRWTSDELYVGMKETYTITRVETGRAAFFTRGKLWSSAPGSLRIQEPGDVVRDIARDGGTTCQIVALPPHTVESVIGKTRVHPHLAAGDTRGAAFQRLHDAVQAGADRLTLDVAVTEAIAAVGCQTRAQESVAECIATCPGGKPWRRRDRAHARLPEEGSPCCRSPSACLC